MAVNKLVANADKTKFLLIRGKKHKKWPEVKVMIGNSIVNESQSEKILGVTVNNKLKWQEQHRNIVNTLREYKQPILKRLAYHLPRWVVVQLLDALVFSSIRYCLPLWGSMRLSDRESPTQLSKSIQVQINFALRCVLGLSLKDQVSVKTLNEMTNSLTLNQLVIQATNRLTTNIINGDCKGLKDFYITEESKKLTRTTRSTENGDLITTTVQNVPHPGFRNQSAQLWNTLTNDRKNLSKLSLSNYP
jgi:hypothetical protein